MFAKVGLTFCQIINNPSKIAQRLLNCSQGSEISPNLVTLDVIDGGRGERERVRGGWAHIGCLQLMW